MNLAQIDPKIVSITALRRDMGLLEKILASQKEAYVCRNQDLLFIAVTPEHYQKTVGFNEAEKKEKAYEAILALRNIKRTKKQNLTNFIIRDRDRKAQKWSKSL